MIGNVKLRKGLYILESKKYYKQSLISPTTQPVDNSHLQQLQWHQHLRHPSFGILDRILPKLTKKCNRNELFCEICDVQSTKEMSILLDMIKVIHLSWLFIWMCGALHNSIYWTLVVL